MKLCVGILTCLVAIVLVAAPATVWSDQMAVPVDRALMPGTTTINYNGETLVFTTNVVIRLQLRALSSTTTQVRFMVHPTQSGGSSASSGNETLEILWQRGGDTWVGDPPDGDWGELELTEGGWTEK